jgi:LPS sulfotransferase NodH
MYDGYILCGTPRTGSTLLCDLLTATGVAGKPDSFFMREVDPVWAREWGLPADDRAAPGYDAALLAAVIRAGTGGTGLFGLRLMRENLEDMTGLLDRVHPGLPSDSARIAAAFGRVLFIHLRREDKLAQAVSMVKAEQTGLWHIAPDGREVERLAPPQAPVYDPDRIARKLAQLEAQDAAWEPWFTQEGITPLRVGYERLSEDPAGMVLRICDALGVAAPEASTLRPGVARLADAISADWIRRFRQAAG